MGYDKYVKDALQGVVNVIPDEIIKGLADLWHLTPMDGVLD